MVRACQRHDRGGVDDDAVSLDTTIERPADASGRDLLAAIAAGVLPPPPAAVLLALDLEEVGDGTTRFGFDARPEIGNPDAAHGGVLAAIADFATSTAVWTRWPADAQVVTTDLHVSFLRGIALDGSRYHCTGQIVHDGRTQANASAEIRSLSGKLHVVALATCRVRPGRRPADGR